MDSKKLIIFALIGFVLSLGIFGATMYFVVFKGGSGSGEVKKPDTYTFEVGEVSTNIGQGRYFKGSITIETTDKKLPESMTTDLTKIRDAILEVIITSDPKEMTTEEGIKNIKTQILNKLSKILETETLTNVYFTDYIVQ